MSELRGRTFIKEWRKHRGMTLENAAERAGMTAGNISAMERGTQGFTQAGLEALAGAYQCDPGHLLSIDPTGSAQEREADETPKRQFLPTFIGQWRNHRGKTLEQLGEVVDMSHAQLSRIERGLQPYSQPVLEAIADALQTDPASLLIRDPSDHDAIWSIWEQANSEQRKLIVSIANAVLKTGKDD
jgi:transcriptional regulator with XRE-family HTH domain